MLAGVAFSPGFSRYIRMMVRPSIGLGLAYIGWQILSYSDICGPRSTLFVDKASLIALVFFAIALIFMQRSRAVFSRRIIRVAAVGGILFQICSLILLGSMSIAQLCTPTTKLILSVVLLLSTGIVLTVWLQQARDYSAVQTTVFVFLALSFNAIVVFALRLFPTDYGAIACGVLMLAQFAMMRKSPTDEAGVLPADEAGKERSASGSGRPAANAFDTQADLCTPGDKHAGEYSSDVRSKLISRRFLVTFAIGLCAIILVAGFLCGFPDDLYKPLGIIGNGVLCVLTVCLCFGVMASSAKHQDTVMTVGIWVILELLAGIALVLYTGFHGTLAIGAVASELLNVMLMGTEWNFTILLIRVGWRESFYYCCVSWVIWFGAHDLGRFMLLILPIGGNSHFTGSVISLLLLISTQIILIKLLDDEKDMFENRVRGAEISSPDEADIKSIPYEDAAPKPNAFERFLGLDGCADEEERDGRSSASIKQQTALMGQQFLLSEREIEVLALYAMGFTQKRVAEELFISPTTAHTHITRIYSKTDLHSRQEILDFMRAHCSEIVSLKS